MYLTETDRQLRAMARSFADKAVQRTANGVQVHAVQVYGRLGYIRGFEVERIDRDAKIFQIYEVVS